MRRVETAKQGVRSNSKALLGGLLLVVVLAVVTTGCGTEASGETSERDADLFVTDRVVPVRIVMTEEDWTATQTNAQAEEYVRADFWFDGELVPDVAVRPKGMSSLQSVVGSGSSRFSLKVDFNFFNSARTLHGLKKVNLNNGWSDPTLIREVLAYELYDQMGIATPRASFIDLWLNDTHLGVYTMVEQIDKTFLGRNFSEDDGNLYKPEMSAGALDWTEADVEEQRAASGISGEDEPESGVDVNVGGGKLSEILRALDLEDSTDGGAVAPDVGQFQRPGGQFQRPDGQQFRPPEGGQFQPPDGGQFQLPDGQQFQPPEGGQFQPPEGGQFQLPDGQQVQPQDGDQAQPRDRGRFGGQFGGMLGGQSGDYLQAAGLKTNENNPDHSALLRLLDVLNNEPDETFAEEIEKVLDVDETLRFLAVSALIVHLDNYLGMGHNYYLYEVDGKFTIIPWDMNMAFGTFNSGLDREGIINFLIDEPTAGPVAEYPLVERLLSYEPYLEVYHGYLEDLLEGSFSVSTMQARINEIADMIRPYVEADDLKFYSTEDFERALTEDLSLGGDAGNMGMARGMGTPLGLETFVVERSSSVRQQLDGDLPSAADGSGNGGMRHFRMPGLEDE